MTNKNLSPYGGTVKITNGPFKGMEATVTYQSDNFIKVILDKEGNSTYIYLDENDFEWIIGELKYD